MTLIEGLWQFIQTKILNSVGAEKDLLEYIADGDIGRAQVMMQNRDIEVKKAIEEYNIELHDVNRRPDKIRRGKEPYYTEKLPRGRAEYINEVELFFLLGRPVQWKALSEGTDNAYKAFIDFLRDTRFNTTMREAKRLAGAETESAKVYHIYQDNGVAQVKVKVISQSKGYTLRPLFDQWDNLIAFGYGYYLKEGTRTVEHFDIETPDTIYRCKHGSLGWEVTPIKNPSGKINVIYYRQRRAWANAQPRIKREEYIDSKAADTNNYFADPKLKVTADVIANLQGGAQNNVGEVITMTGEQSKVEYLAPPEYSTMKDSEKKDLNDSILFDTFTPDFSYGNMKGLGTLSGEALRRAMALGYIKRDNNKETYDILLDREKNLILAIMQNVTHISLRGELSQLEIEHQFSEPFQDDKKEHDQMIISKYQAGLTSLETAVQELGDTDKPGEEVRRIREEKQQATEQFNNNNNEGNEGEEQR